MDSEDLEKTYAFVEAALKKAKLYPHSCKTCSRNYYVFRRAEEASRGIEKCCACRYKGEVVESFLLKGIIR